jgi:hypothetical protein
MIPKNNLQQFDLRRQNQRLYNDAPPHVDIRQSILDLHPIYPEMTNKQFAKWYQKRYGVKAETVLLVITS